MEAAGIEPEYRESQWEKLQQLTSAPDPVAAYLQLVADTHGHSVASSQQEISYILTRWPHLPIHIREAIMILVRSVEPTFSNSVLPHET